MKKIKLMALLFLSMAACHGQRNSNKGATIKENPGKSTSTYIDTTSNPKVEVKVNKKYDDKGNLIRFDSTYSYIYSSPEGKMDHIQSDSLYNDFKSYFRGNYDNLLSNRMNNIFLNDSLFNYDFFNKDYFSKRYEMNMKSFEQLFQQMDSVKSRYFSHNFPQGKIEKNPKPGSVID